jgi:hypothetical protein
MATLQEIEAGIKAIGSKPQLTPQDMTDLKALAAERQRLLDPAAGALSGTNVATAGRSAAEGLAGLPGDIPGMAGGAAQWLTKQATKLPFIGQPGADEGMAQQVGQTVESLSGGGSPMLDIVKALVAMGALPPEAAQRLAPPTSADIHGAVSSQLSPEAEKFTTYQPQNLGEEATQLGVQMLPNLLGGNKTKAVGMGGRLLDIGTKMLTRVAAPTAGGVVTGAVADKLLQNGMIDPDTATAMQVIGVIATGGAGGLMEKGLQMRRAAAAVQSNPVALQALREGLIADGMTPVQAEAFLTNLGGEGTLMDIGPNMRQLGMKAATTPGEGQAAVVNRLETRHAGEGARLGAIREEALGGGVNKDVIRNEIKQELQSIGKGYETAHPQQRAPANARPIVDQIDTELGTVKDPGLRKILEDVKKSLHIQDKHGVATPNLDPSSEGLQAAREAIDSKLYDVTGKKKLTLSPQEDRLLTKYRGAIDDLIEGVNPAVKQVDVAYKAKAGEKTAFQTGEDVLKKGDKVQTAPEFATTWSQMTPEQQQRAVQGASRYVETKMGLTPQERGTLKTMFGGDLNEAKLRTMIGDEKTNAFMEGLRREDTFNETYQKVVHGSRTGQIVEPKGKGSLTEGTGTAFATSTVATGSTKAGGVAAALTMIRNALRKDSGLPQQVRNDIGLLLGKGDDASVLAAADMVEQARKASLAPRMIVPALLQRQSGGPR